jgi:Kinetochore protein CHL4 like
MPRAVSIPSNDTIPSTQLLRPTPLLRRLLLRLPKSSLLTLVQVWLTHPLCPVSRLDDPDDVPVEEESLEDKLAVYASYADDVGVSKRVVVDRILFTDWVCRWSGARG